MSMKALTRSLSYLVLPALLLMSGAVSAAECPEDIKAVTGDNANIPVEILTHRLKPLTGCELQAEAEAWLLILKDKVAEISNAEVAAFYKKEEMAKKKKVEAALEDVKEARVEADMEESQEVEQEAKAVLKDAQEAEQQSKQDTAAQEAMKAAASKIEQDKDAGDAAPDDAAELKKALIKHATDLMADRTIIIDRFNAVLTELAAKGGETEEYDNYIKAVSGIKVDVTDASATWTTISSWLMSPEGGFRWAVNLIQFVLIIVVFYFLSIVAGKATQKATSRSRQLSSLLRDFLVITARRLVFIIGLFVGLSALEINVGPVLAIVGAAGFVIAFALQNSLSNFASGILMLVYRPFDVGEFVNVAGVLGKVESMNLLSTQLRTPDNQQVIVPNNSVWGDVITNITGITERRVDMLFGIGYSDDIDRAQRILEEIVASNDKVLKEPEPIVRLHELGDSSVNFVCRPWVKPADYWDVYWYVTREVKRRFDAEGVSIPFPQRDVHLYQEPDAAS